MKLRNKKTGEVIETCKIIQNAVGTIVILTLDENERYPYEYDSFDELCKDWEDYTPKEPLIKDKKIRKAVRAWAEACFNDNEFWVIYLDERNFTLKANRSDAKATFYSDNKIDDIEEDEFYTITELCGEEE